MLYFVLGLVWLISLMLYWGTLLTPVITRLKPPDFFVRIRFFAASYQVILHVALLYSSSESKLFHVIGALVWLVLAIYAHIQQQAASFGRIIVEPVDAEPPPISPVARLDEIRREQAALDLEARDLERRPDANRT